MNIASLLIGVSIVALSYVVLTLITALPYPHPFHWVIIKGRLEFGAGLDESRTMPFGTSPVRKSDIGSGTVWVIGTQRTILMIRVGGTKLGTSEYLEGVKARCESARFYRPKSSTRSDRI